MRAKPIRDLAAFALAGLALAEAPAAGAVVVQMDQNTVVDLSAPAGNVLVGNVSIADVSLINPRRIAILGRSYGLTNVVVTDRMGRTIFRQEVNVQPPAAGRVTLYRGPLAANFACSPRCVRTPMPGEDKEKNYDPYTMSYKDYSERTRAEIPNQSGGASQ
jgi:hypothetical protein